MEIINDIYNLQNWMEPEKCIPSDWFRWYILSFGVFIFGAYSLFAYHIAFTMNKVLKKITTKRFHLVLAIVFVVCGTSHILHSAGYFSNYFKPFLTITLPVLAIFQTILLINTLLSIIKLKNIRSEEDFMHMVDKNRDLRTELNNLKTLTSQALINKDFNKLKEFHGITRTTS